jgi:hypothetical protein
LPFENMSDTPLTGVEMNLSSVDVNLGGNGELVASIVPFKQGGQEI